MFRFFMLFTLLWFKQRLFFQNLAKLTLVRLVELVLGIRGDVPAGAEQDFRPVDVAMRRLFLPDSIFKVVPF